MEGVFKHNTDFKKFVYDNICQCFDQCINADLKMVPKQSVCTEIMLDDSQDNLCYYDTLLNHAITFFEERKLIIKSGIKYYINENNTKIKLTWENIKTLESNETKELFWLFRKLIIDTMLRQLLLRLNISNDTFKIYSVGSTSLSSDYDITLYGSNNNKVDLITEFQTRFKDLFGDDSSVVFDTNIYGKAFITFTQNKEEQLYYDKVSCNNQTFYALKASSTDSQLMWGLVKYLRDIRDAFGEHIYNDLFLFMSKKIPKLIHLHHANKTLIYLRNKDSEKINYTSLFDIEKTFMNTYNDKLLGMNDYISLINFYGQETYFTRGAFIDTVVNNQMCKEDRLTLSSIDYISSILENAGFFFIHNNKTKYFIRVYNTMLKLITNYPDEFNPLLNSVNFIKFKNIIEGLKTIKDGKFNYDERYCKWIGDDDFDFLYCEKFTLYNILFKLIYNLLSLHSNPKPVINTKREFLFYNNYVIKSTEELGSPSGISPTSGSGVEFIALPECKQKSSMKHGYSLSTLVKNPDLNQL
jgi:hypothetical protein